MSEYGPMGGEQPIESDRFGELAIELVTLMQRFPTYYKDVKFEKDGVKYASRETYVLERLNQAQLALQTGELDEPMVINLFRGKQTRNQRFPAERQNSILVENLFRLFKSMNDEPAGYHDIEREARNLVDSGRYISVTSPFRAKLDSYGLRDDLGHVRGLQFMVSPNILVSFDLANLGDYDKRPVVDSQVDLAISS